MASAYAACQLRTYGATRLPSYTPTRIGKQRGARNGTPRHSWSLLLFSIEELLNLFLILLIFYLPRFWRDRRAPSVLSLLYGTPLRLLRATRLHRHRNLLVVSYSATTLHSR